MKFFRTRATLSIGYLLLRHHILEPVSNGDMPGCNLRCGRDGVELAGSFGLSVHVLENTFIQGKMPFESHPMSGEV